MAWKIIERSCIVVGAIFTAICAYYAAATYYGWNAPVAAQPLPGVGSTATTFPWWLFGVGILGIALIITGWMMIFVRHRQLSTIAKSKPNLERVFPIDRGVYVGRIVASIDKLESDLFIEIGVIAYNGTGRFISIGLIEGAITYENTKVKLPTPSITTPASELKDIGAAHEFVLVLEQRVPRNIADHIIKTLAEKQTATFYLSSLNIRTWLSPNPDFPARFPLWDGITLDQSGRIPFPGKIVTATFSNHANAAARIG